MYFHLLSSLKDRHCDRVCGKFHSFLKLKSLKKYFKSTKFNVFVPCEFSYQGVILEGIKEKSINSGAELCKRWSPFFHGVSILIRESYKIRLIMIKQ